MGNSIGLRFKVGSKDIFRRWELRLEFPRRPFKRRGPAMEHPRTPRSTAGEDHEAPTVWCALGLIIGDTPVMLGRRTGVPSPAR